MDQPRWRDPAICVCLAVVTLAAYWQVGGFEFVNFDDLAYLSLNPHVKRGLTAESIAWAFTTGTGANWHPVTWLSHLADVQLFGMASGAHHRVNLALHAANVVLLFLLLRWMTEEKGAGTFCAKHRAPTGTIRSMVGWSGRSGKRFLSPFPGRAAMVAALFAVHPLNVQSVAWVAERKNLLSTLLGLLAIAAYARYARRPSRWR